MFKKISLIVAVPLIVAAATVASQPAAQATNTPSCIDGSNKNNLVYKWTGYDRMEVSTKEGKALCKDATLFFSTYIMPTTWNKNGFNDTALPQTLNRSVSLKLEAGKPNQKLTVSAIMPSECKNVQIDLYYAPEQTSVTKTYQIGSRLVTAKHKIGTGSCAVVTPQKPQVPVVSTPVVTPTPVVSPTPPVAPQPAPTVVSPANGATVIPTELPTTGGSLINTILPALLATGVYVAILRTRR